MVTFFGTAPRSPRMAYWGESQTRQPYLPFQGHNFINSEKRGDHFQKSAPPPPVKFGVKYTVSGRGKKALLSIYPEHIFSGLKKTDRILDVGAGRGTFIKELREDGFNEAIGIDKAVGNSHGTYQLDIRDLSETYFSNYDHIFSTWSLFTYGEAPSVKRDALKKMASWLRPGGHIYLAPVNPNSIAELLPEIPSLAMTECGEGSDHYVTLTKVSY